MCPDLPLDSDIVPQDQSNIVQSWGDVLRDVLGNYFA